jgi:two-component system sensor histidine kinase UhpB
VALFTIFAANGLTGYSLERLRRQEEEVRVERSLLLVADERVRAETARFLHDEMQSTLLRASMRLSAALPDVAEPRLRALLEQVVDEVDEVREGSIRGVSRSLSPPLSSTGLVVALRELADTYAGVMEVDIEVEAAAAARFRRVLEGDRVALGVYRITEQGLQNALKHGRATKATVRVGSTDGAVRLRILADGDEPPINGRAGTGVAIVNAWLDDLGGEWTLVPHALGGSVFDVRIGQATT